MSERRFLHLFVHLPKTGGAVLMRNGENYLKPDRFLRVNYTYHQYYFDPRVQRIRFYTGESDFKELLNSLSTEQKERIEFMGGHDLYQGIHSTFPRPPRYFLFLREPISRTISLYNYQRGSYDYHLKQGKKLDAWGKILLQRLEKRFLIDGRVPSFEEWLDQSYDQMDPFQFTMTRFLKHLQFSSLEEFFFVGLTETLKEDLLYLHQELGIHRFWADKNASYPYVSYAKLSSRIQERIREKNGEDFALYLRGKALNAQFKQTRSDFPIIVQQMRRRKRLLFPLEKGIYFGKKLLRPLRTFVLSKAE